MTFFAKALQVFYLWYVLGSIFITESHGQRTMADSVGKLLDTSYVLSNTNPEASLIAVENAIHIAKDIENDTLLADSYIEMSYVQSDLGNIPIATEHAFNALEIYEKHDDKSGMAKAFMRIAWDKMVVGEYENVLHYLYESLHLVQATEDSITLSTVYHMLGAAYNWINKYQNIPSKQDSFFMWLDSAIYYDKKAVEIRRVKSIRGLHNTLNNLAMVFERKAIATGEGFNEAEMVYKESFTIRKNNLDTMGMAASCINLAKLFRHKGDYRTALEYAHDGKNFAEIIDYPFHKKLGYNQLHKIYENMGNYDSALFYYKKFIVLNNEAQSAKYKSDIKELESRYEVSKKDKEIELQAQKVQLQRLYLIITGGILALLFLFAIIVFKLYQKNKKLSIRNALLLKEQNHRVKNNLQVISGLLSLQANRMKDDTSRDVIKSSQLRIQTIGLIHKRLYGNEIAKVYIDDFLYELIQQILLSYECDRITKQIAIIKQKIKPHKATGLGLIINELLTNSCKHAFPYVNQPELTINLVHGDYNRVKLMYKDNGPGFRFDKNLVHNSKSFGLNLILLQVEQLNGKATWANNHGMGFCLDFKLE